MRDESHLDDMRAAIRGDFERLAKRRGSQELMQDPADQDPAEKEPEAPPASGLEALESVPPLPPETPPLEPEPQPEPEPEPAPEPLPPAAEAIEDFPSPTDEEIEEQPPRRGLFARLFGL